MRTKEKTMNIDQLTKYFEENPINLSFLGGEFNPRAMAYSTLAQEAYDRDDYMIAVDLYTKGLEIQPRNWYFLSQRAICHRMMNNYDQSLSDALRSIQIENNFENNQTAALCCLFKKDFQKAVEFFDITIAHLNKLEESDQSEMMGIDYGATKSRALNNQAVCYYNLQQLDKAVQAATKGIEANPSYSNNYFVRGMILMSLEEKAKAVLDLQNAARYGDTRAVGILEKL